jgi:hypothetical protein
MAGNGGYGWPPPEATADYVRTLVYDTRDEAPPVSTSRLRDLGYQTPELDAEDLEARNRHRDDQFLSRLRAVPATGDARAAS